MDRAQLEQAFEQAKAAGDFENAYRIEQELRNTPAAPEEKSSIFPLQRQFVNRFVEPAVTMGTAMVAEPVAGIAGGAQLRSGRGLDAAANTVDAARESFTYSPRSPEGQQSLQNVAQWLGPVAEAIGAVEQRLGDVGYDLAGPTGGMLGELLPTATMELLGLGAVRKGKNVAQSVKNATPNQTQQNILDAGQRFDVPILTTDVKPPTTFFGRWGQSLSEKLGPLGSGTARASQQAAREAAVRGFAEYFDIELDSPFADQMIKSLSRQRATELQTAGAQRTRAINNLIQYGNVPMDETRKAIQKQIVRQMALKDRANTELITKLEDTLTSMDGDFSHVRDIRTEVIEDLRDMRKGDNARAAGAMQQVKSAMDRDMLNFAKANDRNAAADWVKSNRAFADAYQRTKNTELKRMLDAGEVTPEIITPIIRGGKASQLNRLYRSMDDAGRDAARRLIIQDALKDSKYFEVDANPNPNTFATALNKPNRQHAFKVFFRGDAKKEIDGLARLLQATRRAQDGSAVLKTGEQNLLMILGGMTGAGAYAAPGVVIPTVAIGSAIAKAYESTLFRNLLLRLGNTQRGSKAETGLLELAATSVVAELQAAKEEQEEMQRR